ncbi:DUF6412 domain-containing protein [Allokutzneria oryzae]|uniref:DUF6412 domain-containing protein n=1 Tax=Allokutzneria oryzae TaxID=1378989 RepID=A0ABV6A5D0_9PSEU
MLRLVAELGLFTAPSLLAALSLALAAAAVLLVAGRVVPRGVTTGPVVAVAVALRERARRTAFLPQRDPTAPGRPRPRAPGSGSVAA